MSTGVFGETMKLNPKKSRVMLSEEELDCIAKINSIRFDNTVKCLMHYKAFIALVCKSEIECFKDM